jgi:hypothetical protein
MRLTSCESADRDAQGTDSEFLLGLALVSTALIPIMQNPEQSAPGKLAEDRRCKSFTG